MSATSEPYFPVPCDSRCVDGFVRGGMVGTAWSIFFPARAIPETSSFASALRIGGTNAIRTGSLCGCFMAIYNLCSCEMEVIRGRRDQLNGLVAGCVTGMACAYPSNSKRLMVTSGVACGLMGMLVESVQN